MSSHKRLLLVEDEAVIAFDQKIRLEEYGYSVVLAGSGEEAVGICRDDEGIELVLMDIDLGGGLDGPAAARTILKEKFIPIIFLSSHTSREIVEKIEKITSYGYVVKNTGITALDASIKMAFRLFEAHRKIEDELRELERSQALLRERDLFLKEVLKIAELGGWRADPNTDFLEWTDGVYDIIEAPRDYSPGLTEGLKYYPPEYGPLFKNHLSKCLHTGEKFSVEVEAVTEKGERIWTEVRGIAPIIDGERSYVIGTLKKIDRRGKGAGHGNGSRGSDPNGSSEA